MSLLKNNILHLTIGLVSINYLSLFFLQPLWQNSLWVGVILFVNSLLVFSLFFVEQSSNLKKYLPLVVVLLFSFVFLEKAHNDIYRFLWEGWIMKNGLNPYLYSPELVSFVEPFKHLSNVPYWDLLDFKGFVAVYGPAAMIIFYIPALVLANSIIAYKMLMLFFVLSSIILLYKLIEGERGKKYILPIFLSPLFLFEGVAGAHLETVMMFLLLLALYLYQNKRGVLLGFVLSFLSLIKFYPLLFLPFFITKKNYYQLIPSFIISSFLIIWPFYNAKALENWMGFFEYFNEVWIASPGIALFFSSETLRLGLLVLLILFLLYKKTKPAAACFYVTAYILFTSQVVFSWYFLPLTVLLPFVKEKIKWVLILPAFTFSLQYTLIRPDPAINNTFIYLNNGLILWHQLVLWLPSLILALWFLLLYLVTTRKKLL